MKKTKINKHIYWFKELSIKDIALVGGKNAALGEMYRELTPLGVKIPNGFAISAEAYRYFISFNDLDQKIKKLLEGLNTHNVEDLAKRGEQIRQLIQNGAFPKDLEQDILLHYRELSRQYKMKNVDVAVRSSATAEDLPGASFAGQQETFLNIRGNHDLLIAVKNCFASLFTDRAISYRQDKGFSAMKVALSVGVQKMVRADKACSGVLFTLDTETGFDKVIVINGIYGLGELIVQGKVIPDEFIVFKPSLKTKYFPIISHRLGDKNIKMIYSSTTSKQSKPTKVVMVNKEQKLKFVLTDKEIIELAEKSLIIEQHFSKKHHKYTPMDIEWAKDGITNELFIVQARPETVHAVKNQNTIEEYSLLEKDKRPVLVGIAIGTKIAVGKAHVIKDVKDISNFKAGEILVTEITDPDWEPIMKIASGIITDKGGRTSHAAIVSRELGVPCIVGTQNATKILKTGQILTIDCSSGETGFIYSGQLKYKVIRHSLQNIPDPKVKISVNIGSPDEAFRYHNLPVHGVGLGRLEFIIASQIKVHPNLLIDYEKIKSGKLSFPLHNKQELQSIINKVQKLTAGYTDKKQYYVDKLAEGIAKIAAAFWPEEVVIRFSDFKTNEYETLLGGTLYEPQEENPMIGWRGASRYYDPKFTEAFGLECKAIKKVRDFMGFANVVPMIPFCRTIQEAKAVLKCMARYGLKRTMKQQKTKNSKQLKIYVMAEIPSNALLADEFLSLFDGMSIGSNDLTQLTIGLDRDSGILSHIANEKDESVKKMIAMIISACNRHKKYVGICGQAPSDYPEFAQFLKKTGIQAISLNPDSVIRTIITLAKENTKKVKKEKTKKA